MPQPSNAFLQASNKVNLPFLPIPHTEKSPKAAFLFKKQVKKSCQTLTLTFAPLTCRAQFPKATPFPNTLLLDPKKKAKVFNRISAKNIFNGEKAKKLCKRMNPVHLASTAKQNLVSLIKRPEDASNAISDVSRSFMENFAERSPATSVTSATPETSTDSVKIVSPGTSAAATTAASFCHAPELVSVREEEFDTKYYFAFLKEHANKPETGELQRKPLLECRFLHTHSTETTSSYNPKSAYKWAHHIAPLEDQSELERSPAPMMEVWTKGKITRAKKTLADVVSKVHFLQPAITKNFDLDCYLCNMKNPTFSTHALESERVPGYIFADREYRLFVSPDPVL
ncbi:hypothetical protein ACO0QE_001461 [Hanseniaspora vineae]